MTTHLQYSNDCEWLEAKAAEAAAESKARRLQKEASRDPPPSVSLDPAEEYL